MFCNGCGSELVATAVVCPKCGTAAPNAPKVSTKTPLTGSLLLAGWIFAVLVPFIGIILGIITLTRGPATDGKTTAKPTEQGIGMIAVSLLCWFIWAAIFAAR